MRRAARSRVTNREALAVVYAAHQRYGTKQFTVDLAGPNYPALLHAQSCGWVWFIDQRHASVTRAGLMALAPYGVEVEA